MQDRFIESITVKEFADLPIRSKDVVMQSAKENEPMSAVL
jgi:hypothetical protein